MLSVRASWSDSIAVVQQPGLLPNSSLIFTIVTQDLQEGELLLLRNSARDGKKGDKLNKRWLGPYRVDAVLGKGLYQLANPNTGRVLKKAVNGCRYANKD